MHQNITIINPSERVVKALDALRDKKQKQIKKLAAMEKCTFTIKV